MRHLVALWFFFAIALPAAAFDLGNHAPTKPADPQFPPPPDPELTRQGGDTVLDAVLLT